MRYKTKWTTFVFKVIKKFAKLVEFFVENLVLYRVLSYICSTFSRFSKRRRKSERNTPYIYNRNTQNKPPV